MIHFTTELLIIGGRSTGTGVAWDAALRGFHVALVEKRDLTDGATGRYHRLPHSGDRPVTGTRVRNVVSGEEFASYAGLRADRLIL